MTELSQFHLQVAALSPVTVRCLARWQRDQLAKRNPHLSPMLDSMSDTDVAERYLRHSHDEIQRLEKQTELAKHNRAMLRAASSVSLVQKHRWSQRQDGMFLRLV